MDLVEDLTQEVFALRRILQRRLSPAEYKEEIKKERVTKGDFLLKLVESLKKEDED